MFWFFCLFWVWCGDLGVFGIFSLSVVVFVVLNYGFHCGGFWS